MNASAKKERRLIMNDVENHVLAGRAGAWVFVLPNLRKCKNFKVSKAAVKTSFLWFAAAFVIVILENAQSI